MRIGCQWRLVKATRKHWHCWQGTAAKFDAKRAPCQALRVLSQARGRTFTSGSAALEEWRLRLTPTILEATHSSPALAAASLQHPRLQSTAPIAPPAGSSRPPARAWRSVRAAWQKRFFLNACPSQHTRPAAEQALPKAPRESRPLFCRSSPRPNNPVAHRLHPTTSVARSSTYRPPAVDALNSLSEPPPCPSSPGVGASAPNIGSDELQPSARSIRVSRPDPHTSLSEARSLPLAL